MVDLAVKAAHEHDKLAVAHISTEEFAKVAFESDVDGLVHLFADEPASDELVELDKEQRRLCRSDCMCRLELRRHKLLKVDHQ